MIFCDSWRTALSYKIIEGFPQNVELEVRELLSLGWELNGVLFPRIHDGHHLVVQSLIRDTVEEESELSGDLPQVSPSLSNLIQRVTQEPNNSPPTLDITNTTGNT
jgi:hypothetical protein